MSVVGGWTTLRSHLSPNASTNICESSYYHLNCISTQPAVSRCVAAADIAFVGDHAVLKYHAFVDSVCHIPHNVVIKHSLGEGEIERGRAKGRTRGGGERWRVATNIPRIVVILWVNCHRSGWKTIRVSKYRISFQKKKLLFVHVLGSRNPGSRRRYRMRWVQRHVPGLRAASMEVGYFPYSIFNSYRCKCYQIHFAAIQALRPRTTVNYYYRPFFWLSGTVGVWPLKSDGTCVE